MQRQLTGHEVDSLTIIWGPAEVLSLQCVVKKIRDSDATGRGRVLTGKETL